MKIFVVLTITAAVLGLKTAFKPPTARYDDFKVYKVYVKDEQQFADFKKLTNNIPVSKAIEMSSVFSMRTIFFFFIICSTGSLFE